jgi:methylated-DNA-[protein]-cysteine S-methyltransferase
MMSENREQAEPIRAMLSSHSLLKARLWRKKEMNYFHHRFKTKIGNVHLLADEKNIWVVAYEANWEKLRKKYPAFEEKSSPLIKLAQTQILDFLSGKRKDFDLPFQLEGTDFQKKVWQSLLKIPYGKTVSYQEQAAKMKMPLAIRAIARTNALNPISIVLPCHRVIGKSGKLTGYAGGLDAKAFLLSHENPDFSPQ